MAKDRNTFAKRQREVDKKHKANQKRERRAKRKTSDPNDDPDDAQSSLSSAEHSVLSVFRKYLMTPGKMLCIGKPDLETFSLPLAQLTSKGMLVADRFQGGYSLTESGFAAMKDGQ